MKYQTLTINKFRGISNLEIADFRRVNLLVGRNNCGKTSVLEAIFLLSGMGNPQLSINIHTFRDLSLSKDDDFSYMFKNLNFSNPIELKGRIDSNERMLTITPFYGSNQPIVESKVEVSQPEHLTATSNIRAVEGINLDLVTNKSVKYHGELHIKEGRINIPGGYKENLSCSYLSPKNANLVTDKLMEDLLIHKKLDTIISVLKGIEPAVQDIRMGARSVVYVDIGAERLIPINVMGDGLRKTLGLLAAIAARKNGILLIDEIENGLHYSSLTIAWKAIFSACKEYNVQIIATTHSYECVEAFSKTYDSMDPEGDDIRLFRIDKEGEKHKTFSSTSKVLRSALDKEFEVR